MDTNIKEFLDSYSPEVREIALEIRESVFGLVPEVQEKVYGGWKSIGYSFSGGMKDAIFAIAPQRTHVNLIFMRGVELDDPDKLLEGSGKRGRHRKIKKIDDLETKGLKSLMESAIKLARTET